MTTNTLVTDPVCGMTIDPAEAVATTTYNGQSYHFCAASCLRTFTAAPSQYAVADEAGCCAEKQVCGCREN